VAPIYSDLLAFCLSICIPRIKRKFLKSHNAIKHFIYYWFSHENLIYLPLFKKSHWNKINKNEEWDEFYFVSIRNTILSSGFLLLHPLKHKEIKFLWMSTEFILILAFKVKYIGCLVKINFYRQFSCWFLNLEFRL
jgi:hypothetical protein